MPVEKSKFNIYKIKESNVLPCQMIKKDCHFYGVNDASNKKKIYDYFLNFFLISSALRMWDYLEEIFKKRSIKALNLSDNSLIESFKKIRFTESLEIKNIIKYSNK